MNFILENWDAILSIITFLTGGGLFLGWKVNKAKADKATSEANKATSEAETSNTDSVKNIRDLYNLFIEDYKIKYDELTKCITQLQAQMKAVQIENVEQRKDLRNSHSEINELRKEIGNWKEKYTQLKLEFELYKAKDSKITSGDGGEK